ncbi:DsbA family oxidoreductase [Nocardioides panacisoli]|uniref:DsbA family oxidoreductase n=1 Tax=Nocardioides panacisoli TaxID=627624 RepID=UPI001C624B1C|nr:DsbA family oxidoreductase [Nocardioides panacisoli]QYJ04472.1 DsbA family oxidoreductase [Nocardioides panacisoli]
MRIEIWSDVVCPWCYIGKRRWEGALAEFEHADQVEVVWRSFQLDPGASTEPGPVAAEHLGRKYGGGSDAGRDMVDRMEAVAAEEGMVWRHHESRPVNTVDAHRLLHLALAESGTTVQATLKEELLAAYFVRAENIADHEVLRTAAEKAGLPADRVADVLASGEYRQDVFADQDQAHEYGAGGVPFAVVDGRYGVSGAQPAATLLEVLHKAWEAAHPVVEMTGAAGADVCGPDGCS